MRQPSQLREKVSALRTAGKSTSEIARELGCNYRTVQRLVAKPKDEKPKWIPKKEIILADVHIPEEDEQALKAAIEYGQSVKPDLVFLQEVLELEKVSSWAKDPSHMPLKDEIEKGRKFLKRVRDAFPHSKIILMLTNHESNTLQNMGSRTR